VAKLSKVWVCDRLIAENVGFNPTGGGGGGGFFFGGFFLFGGEGS